METLYPAKSFPAKKIHGLDHGMKQRHSGTFRRKRSPDGLL